MADNYKVLRARPEDLPAFTVKKNDTPGTGVDCKVSPLNRVYVSYCDDSSPINVKVTYTSNLGETWSDPVTVEGNVEDCQTAITFDPIARVYCFFVKKFDGVAKLAYRRSDDAGATWGDLQDTGEEV
jgi:Neuraminidase (sialidase)